MLNAEMQRRGVPLIGEMDIAYNKFYLRMFHRKHRALNIIFMYKIICFLLATCWLFSCNKAIDEMELPPFSVIPNPFSDTLNVYFDTNRVPDSHPTIRILDGKDNVIISLDYSTSIGMLSIQMLDYEKGIYYLEMDLDGTTFTEPILKVE